MDAHIAFRAYPVLEDAAAGPGSKEPVGRKGHVRLDAIPVRRVEGEMFVVGIGISHMHHRAIGVERHPPDDVLDIDPTGGPAGVRNAHCLHQ